MRSVFDIDGLVLTQKVLKVPDKDVSPNLESALQWRNYMASCGWNANYGSSKCNTRKSSASELAIST
eukprot:3795196-Amphidinium_carterae.1